MVFKPASGQGLFVAMIQKSTSDFGWSSAAVMVGMSALYGWLYLGWLDRLDAASDDTLLQLTRNGERLRWRTAAAAMWIVLLEVCLHRVASWGIYLAVFAAATGYFQSDMATTRLGGGYFLSKGQQAMNRRLAMLPAMCVYFYGTDFARSSLPHYLILTVALFTALVMILLPEPSE